MTNANSIWAEKYRPKTLDEYVWRDETLKKKVEQWVHERYVPHVLFVGDPGVGKTSLAWLILKVIGIPPEDILYIPASRDRKIENVGDQVRNFIQSWAWMTNDTGMKYIILDEADSLSQAVQKSLRADMEVYEHTCRFIFTANYLRNIIEPISSRAETYIFSKLDHDEFVMRLVDVMRGEGIDVEDEKNIVAMMAIVDTAYPDLRRSIGLLAQNSYTEMGKDENGADIVKRRYLEPPNKKEAEIVKPFLLQATDLIFQGHLNEARNLIVKSASADEYPDLYRWMYQNLNFWGKTEGQQDDALLAIRKGLVHHGMVADIEINLSATLVELKMIALR